MLAVKVYLVNVLADKGAGRAGEGKFRADEIF